MTISVGDKLPETKFKFFAEDGPAEISTAELFNDKKVVLFGVPGAFTPTCNNNHLPGYVTRLDELKAKGVNTVAVVSVNDLHVMKAWQDASGGGTDIVFLADGNGEFVKEVGLDIDLSIAGMGVRSQRFSMIVDNAKVAVLNIEENPGQAVTSGVEKILEDL